MSKKNAKLQIADVREGNSSEQRHVLIVESSESKRAVTVRSAIYTIGRHPENSLVISSKQVSRYHATILWLKSRETNQCAYWILDGTTDGKRSLNGISLNGIKCSLQQLKDGDVIMLGDYIKIRYTCMNTATLSSLDVDRSTLTTVNNPNDYQDATVISSFAERDNSSENQSRSKSSNHEAHPTF
jgi:pSer/pThr/pTyr-binding forkhead associated (FHA) protein